MASALAWHSFADLRVSRRCQRFARRRPGTRLRFPCSRKRHLVGMATSQCLRLRPSEFNGCHGTAVYGRLVKPCLDVAILVLDRKCLLYTFDAVPQSFAQRDGARAGYRAHINAAVTN